jgi:trimeric autotransporter adhesin
VTEAKLADGVAISGPQGPPGPQGEQGAPGPSTGPAGGDLTGNYPDPVIANLAVTLPKLADNSVNSAKVVDGSLTAADLNLATLPFWRTAGNAGTNPATDFLGTTDNRPLNFRVSNSRALRLEPALFDGVAAPNVVGGGTGNALTAGVHSATIGGGGRAVAADAATANRVTDNAGTVGGGAGNRAGNANATTTDAEGATVGGGKSNVANGASSTVGGGESNAASGNRATIAGGRSNTTGGAEATVAGGRFNNAAVSGSTVGGGNSNTASLAAATVAGGDLNTASGPQATVAGGDHNTASGTGGFVGGGQLNTASGRDAMVPGGLSNTAQGFRSFAAGSNASANHEGAFVWAHHRIPTMASTDLNQFIARAQGRFYLTSTTTLPQNQGLINTSAGAAEDGTGGAFLSTGGAWTDASDARMKEGFADVEPGTVLAKVADLPVRSWNYKAEPGVRHLGPTAQDFHAAFGLGADDRHIASLDSAGVALAAIKGLSEENAELRETVVRQGARLAALEIQVARAIDRR